MKLYINKKIEFASSHKYWKDGKSEQENASLFGISSLGKYGHGHNFTAYFTFSGDIDRKTGMIVELSKIKHRILETVMKKYDHKFLNRDIDVFKTILPTPERIAEALLKEAEEAFQDWPVVAESCHLVEDHAISATAYKSRPGVKTLTYQGFLDSTPTDINISFEGTIDDKTDMIFNDIDHYETIETIVFKDESPLIEIEDCLSLFQQLQRSYKLHRLQFKNDLFCLDVLNEAVYLTNYAVLNATHRLQCEGKTAAENESLFGKCSNPHGHDFLLEMTQEIDSEELSSEFITTEDERLESFIAPFQYLSLEEETPLFKGMLCTCENMIFKFKEAYEQTSGKTIIRTRLKETPNNRFTLRNNEL